MEKLVDVTGYEGLYKVSDSGAIYSIDRIVKRSSSTNKVLKGKMIKPQLGTNGYYFVCLSKNSIVKQMLVHRIVAISFLGYKAGMEVNHINENKADNRLCNLEWISHKSNMNHGTLTERRVSNSDFKGKNNPMYGKCGIRNPNSKAVRQYTKDNEFVREYGSVREAAMETGFNASYIAGAANGRYNYANGFIWKYAN